MNQPVKVGVVGPCAAGKSTLVASLKGLGYNARHIAQEHSYAPAMWQRISNPDFLVFLDVSYELAVLRRDFYWDFPEYVEQQRRLQHARQHADLYIDTDPLSPGEVLERVTFFLNNCGG